MSDTGATGKIIEGHDYDGIRELDNELPQWWRVKFYLTMLFAAAYVIWYEAGPGEAWLTTFQREQFHREVAELARGRTRYEPDESALLALAKDPGRMNEGRKVFEVRCVSCHGSKGEGGIGPNLTDAYWIHGGKPAQVARVVNDGILDKGMPPWGPVLTRLELESTVAYVRTLRGLKVTGKPPQGDLDK